MIPPNFNPKTVIPIVSNTYGVWNAAVEADPSGKMIQNTIQGAVTSALIFGAIGYLVPGLTTVEGLKWGAITGGAKALYSHFNRS